MEKGIGLNNFCSSTLLPIRIVGNSMFPFLRDGVEASVKLCPIKQIQKGDITVFKSGTEYTAHRVMGKVLQKGSLFLRTKGDIDFTYDKLVDDRIVAGKIISLRIGAYSIRIDSFTWRLFGLAIGYSEPLFVKLYFFLKNIIHYDSKCNTDHS